MDDKFWGERLGNESGREKGMDAADYFSMYFLFMQINLGVDFLP